jgi:ethanolamine utilization microcompartment shell protein EutL
MLRSEVTTGLNALRYMLEKSSGFQYSSEDDKEYYDEVLTEAIRAVLLNEQNDPYAPKGLR